MTAAALTRVLEREFYEVQLLECAAAAPQAIGTLPSFGGLCSLLGIDARELMRATRATFKLGAQFRDWGHAGDRYFRGFGPSGARLDGVPFHSHWLRLHRLGDEPGFEEYSPVAALAHAGRFALPDSDRRSPFFWYSYAYHLDGRELADYLRRYALRRGLRASAANIVDVQLHPVAGSIQALRLDDGSAIEADMVIDCTANRGGPVWRAVGARFEEWHRWLPCNRALSMPGPPSAELSPYTCFTAAEHGWRWEIPLQDGTDRGYAYSSDFSTEAQVESAWRTAFPGASPEQAVARRFSCGRPDRFWISNVLFLGACNPGPLEAVELHLLQSGITRFLGHFPGLSPESGQACAQEYNRLSSAEHDGVRDFLALHFCATSREDSPLWKHCRACEPPTSLRERLELFRHSGRLQLAENDCFGEEGWLAVLLGQHVHPTHLDPLAVAADIENTRGAFRMLSARIRSGIADRPGHRDFLAQHGLLASTPAQVRP